MANVVMTALQIHRLRIGFNGYLEGGQTLMITVRILVATVLMAALAWAVWSIVNHLLGHALAAQVVAVGLATLASAALYAKLMLAMRVPEAYQIKDLVMSRLRSSGATR